MDRGVKIVLAAVVLAVGVAGALHYRHRGPRLEATLARPDQPLVLRHYTAPAAPESRWSGMGAAEASSPGAVSPPGPPATVRARLTDPSPAPQLARTYPRLEGLPMPHPWGGTTGRASGSNRGQTSVRYHLVVDGDTLAELARRYLGSARRAGEIFEANRDVLPSPDALPIGARLRIPPRLVPVALDAPLDRARLAPVDSGPAEQTDLSELP